MRRVAQQRRLFALALALAGAGGWLHTGDDAGPAIAVDPAAHLRADVRALPRRRRARRPGDEEDDARCATSTTRRSARARSTDEIVRVIMAGKGQMPAFGSSLSMPKMQALAGYVRRLGGQRSP